MARGAGWCRTLEDAYEATRELSDTQAAALLLAVCRYYFDGTEPEGLPRAAGAAFSGVRAPLKRARAARVSWAGRSGSDE